MSKARAFGRDDFELEKEVSFAELPADVIVKGSWVVRLMGVISKVTGPCVSTRNLFRFCCMLAESARY